MMNKCALIRTKYIRFMLIRIKRQVGKARFDSTFLSYIVVHCRAKMHRRWCPPGINAAERSLAKNALENLPPPALYSKKMITTDFSGVYGKYGLWSLNCWARGFSSCWWCIAIWWSRRWLIQMKCLWMRPSIKAQTWGTPCVRMPYLGTDLPA